MTEPSPEQLRHPKRPNPVVRMGEFVDARAKWWTVDACNEHAWEIER
jgi:hypothetical protein